MGIGFAPQICGIASCTDRQCSHADRSWRRHRPAFPHELLPMFFSIEGLGNIFNARGMWGRIAPELWTRGGRGVHVIVLQLSPIEGFDLAWRGWRTRLEGAGIFSTNTSASSSVPYGIVFHLLFLSEALVISKREDCKGKPRENDEGESLILDLNRLGKTVGSWKPLIHRLLLKQYIPVSSLLHASSPAPHGVIFLRSFLSTAWRFWNARNMRARCVTSMKMSDTRSARSGAAAEPAYSVSSYDSGPVGTET